MFKTTLLAIIAVGMGASAQFALSITEPLNNEFIQLGQAQNVTVHADVAPGTSGPNIQLALCQVISGPPTGCDLTSGTVILQATAFLPPDQTYSVFIPANQAPGTTRLLVGHISGTTVTDLNSINIFLGERE